VQPTACDVSLGTLRAGRYTVGARVYAADGAAFEVATKAFDVLPLEGRCNADPLLSPRGLIVLPNASAGVASERLANDPAYAQSLGNPTLAGSLDIGGHVYLMFGYPPLDDLTLEMARVDATGDFQVSRNGWVCFAPSPPDSVARVVEFYNADLDHYFYTADSGEIAAIDAGRVGNWRKTGKSFAATVALGCMGSQPAVYRFAGVPGKGPSSHFSRWTGASAMQSTGAASGRSRDCRSTRKR
jgi:hypothetical protein